MRAYVDSSVILRVIFNEADQLAEWTELDPVSNDIARVECLRAIERLRRSGTFDDAELLERRDSVLDILARFRLVEPARPVLTRAADPFPVYVATLDAIHLATAMELRAEEPDLLFATHDAKLAAAARSVEFAVLGS